MGYYVYIIQSQIDCSYYKGYSENYLQRIEQHNLGLSKYTSRKRPWHLVYLEYYESKKSALVREKSIKKYSHEQIQNLIQSAKNKNKDLVDEWLKSIPNRVGD